MMMIGLRVPEKEHWFENNIWFSFNSVNMSSIFNFEYFMILILILDEYNLIM